MEKSDTLSESRHRIPPALALVLILLLAAVLRFYGLGSPSLWWDEAASVWVARKPLPEILPTIQWAEKTPPLHYYLLHFLMRVAGDSEWMVRLPSALAGVASVWAAYALARKLYVQSAAPALAAAVWMACSPYQIYYAQEARAYVFMVLLALLSSLAFVVLLDAKAWSWRAGIAYVLCSALLLYTHLYGVFVILAQNSAYAWARRVGSAGRLTPARWIAMQFAVIVLFALMLPVAIGWLGDPKTSLTVAPVTGATVLDAYVRYAGSVAALGALGALCYVSLRANRDGAKGLPTASVLLIGLVILPVVVPAIISMMRKPIFVPRHGIVAGAALFVLAAGSMVALRKVAWQAIAVAGFVGLSLLWTAPIAAPKRDWRAAGELLTRAMKPGDVAAYNCYETIVLYDYYVRRADVRSIGFTRAQFPEDAQPKPGGSLWLILHDSNPSEDKLLAANPRWWVRSRHQFSEGGIVVIELTEPAPSSGPSSS
jgi:hypothetical protein